MKTKLLLKPLLLAVGLLVGGNAWGAIYTLYSQDYESATDASSWVTQNLAPTLVTGDATYGKFIQMSVGNNNSRSTYTTWGSTIYGDYNTYTLEFDANFTILTNNTKNQSSSFAIMADEYLLPNANYEYDSDYIFKFKSKANTTTFSINEETAEYTMPSGTWCHYTIVVDGEDGTATYTITNKSTSEQLATGTYNIPSGKSYKAVGMYYLCGRYWSEGKFDNISITTEVNTEVVAAPTIAITGVNGANRTVTITGGTSTDGTATVTTYYTTDGTDPTSSSSVYSSALTITEDCTVKAVSISDKGGISSVSSLAVTTGEITLNAPVISRSGNSVTITSNQSDKVGNPTATIFYTYGDGDPVEYSGAITVEADATITAYASATGYTNSDNVTRAVALFPTDVAKVIDAPENNTYTTGALSGVDVAGTNATFQAVMIDGARWGGENVYVQSTNFMIRNGGSGKDWYFNSTSDVWLLIKYVKAGDIIVVNTSYQASNLTNATYTEKYSEGNNRAYTVTADGNVEIAFKKPSSKTMHYIYGLYVWSHPATATINPTYGWATFCSPYALDFSNVTGLKAYIATAADDTKVSLERVNGTVAANTGLVIRGATTDIPVVASGTTYSSEENRLVPCLEKTTLTPITGATRYVLSVQTIEEKEEVVFAEVGVDNKYPTIEAGQAYLSIPLTASTARAQFLTLSFGNVATGISTVEAQKTVDGEVYNLSGQRVSQPTKGLYIVNGKKVIK